MKSKVELKLLVSQGRTLTSTHATRCNFRCVFYSSSSAFVDRRLFSSCLFFFLLLPALDCPVSSTGHAFTETRRRRDTPLASPPNRLTLLRCRRLLRFFPASCKDLLGDLITMPHAILFANKATVWVCSLNCQTL